MEETKPFWLVWSRGKARLKHSTHEAAQVEAERLSKIRPGRGYYVMEMRACYRVALTPSTKSGKMSPYEETAGPVKASR